MDFGLVLLIGRDSMPDSLFTIQQAATQLLCKPRTVRHYVKTKQLGHLRLGRRLYFSQEDIAAFIEHRHTPAAGGVT